MLTLVTIELRSEHDLVLARQRARQVAAAVGLDLRDQTGIATAVSEIARNAFRYAGGGRVELELRPGPDRLQVTITDQGPGIAKLKEVTEGTYQSPTGMGLGIIGTRRLTDFFDIDSKPGKGTTVAFGKLLPPHVAADARLASHIAAELAQQRPGSALEEIQQQNQELIGALNELRQQREELAETNRELQDTNRGVLALLAELDDKAADLQRANEVKTRFLSNMTHEFRTPVNSVLSLTRLLLERVDGPLAPEQELQVSFIRTAAESLSELVDDLLDLAKVEAGKMVVHLSPFEVSELFSGLRGMLKPLLGRNSAIELIFEEPRDLPTLYTDESKLSQILRNFISNALKFTERGTIRVSARAETGSMVVFSVEDTGIGIAPEDQERIFEEYTQIDSIQQRRTKGSGLGLPLTRKLAGLLGGSVGVRSTPGAGSTFYAIIPAECPQSAAIPEVTPKLDPNREPVLVVEDNREALFIYEKYLRDSHFQVLSARTVRDAEGWLRTIRPIAIVLDVLLETESTWGFLSDLKRRPVTKDIPVIVVTMVDNERRARNLGADAFMTKPIDGSWLVRQIEELSATHPPDRILVIDDDEISRYLLRGFLVSAGYAVDEAPSGAEGLARAREREPKAIFLDLAMPEMSGADVLRALEADPATRQIPVIVHTAKALTEADRRALSAAALILPKEATSQAREMAQLHIEAALTAVGLPLSRSLTPASDAALSSRRASGFGI